MDRVRGLWFAWLAVWAAGQIVYGAVAPWAVAATALATAGLLALSLVLLPGGLALSPPTLVFLGAIAAVFALQFLPLSFLSPVTAHLRSLHKTDGLFCTTADAFLTLRVLAQVASYAASALLVLKLRREGLTSSSLLQSLCALLLAQAAYAVLQQALAFKDVPFYGCRASVDSASGTLVGRNTFAGLMAMGAVGAAALATSRFLGRRRLDSAIGWALAAAFFLVGIVLSKSRGGSVGAAVGLLLLPLLHRGRGSLPAALAVLAAGILGVCVADPSLLAGRFNELDPQDLRGDTRWRIWTSTASAATQQPVLGHGIGTHPTAYHPYQPVDLVGQVHHAHNEYVNFFFEGGVLWLLTLTAGLGWWYWRTWSSSQRLPGPDRIFPAAAIAAACAEAAHSMVDFDLRVTSAGLLFAALIGLGGSVQRSTSEPKTLHAALVAAVAAIVGLLLLLPLDSDAIVDDAVASPPERAALRAREALRLSPTNYRAAWILARATGEPDRYAIAADLWPAHAELQKDVGLYFWERGDRARAARCLQRLFEQRPQEVEPVLREIWSKERALSDYETLLPEAPSAWGAYAGFIVAKGKWREGLDAFQKGVPERPANVAAVDVFAARLTVAGQWGMAAAVLERRLKVKSDPPAHAASARAWAKLEAWDRALAAARMARRTDPLNVEWVLLEAELLRADHQLEKALEALMEALRLAPLEVGVRMKRAALYVEMKLWTSAADDYKAVLKSRPGDREATLGLAQAQAASGAAPESRKLLDGTK